MAREAPIDRAIACLRANFELLGLPLLHDSQFEAIALSVLRSWATATPKMMAAVQKHVEEGHVSREYPDSDGVFVFGDIGTVWEAMVTAANNEVVDRRG